MYQSWGSDNRRFCCSSAPWPDAAPRRSVQDGNNKPSNAPFDFDGIAGRIDDTDKLIYRLSLIVEAQFIPHGQMIADLRVVGLLVQLQLCLLYTSDAADD